jgi:hypothetical protein
VGLWLWCATSSHTGGSGCPLADPRAAPPAQVNLDEVAPYINSTVLVNLVNSGSLPCYTVFVLYGQSSGTVAYASCPMYLPFPAELGNQALCCSLSPQPPPPVTTSGGTGSGDFNNPDVTLDHKRKRH